MDSWMSLSLLDEAILWAIAVGTAYVTAVLAKKLTEAEGLMQFGYSFFLLTVLAGMPAAALGYLYVPNFIGAFWAVWINMGFMTVGLIPMIYGFMLGFSDYSGANRYSKIRLGSWPWVRWCVIFLILLNEFMMGWAFLLVNGAAPVIGQLTLIRALEGFGAIVSSSWFVFSMAIEMFVSLFIFRRNFPRVPFLILMIQAMIMMLTPTALSYPAWRELAIYGGSALMTVLFILLFDYLYRNNILNIGFSKYIVALVGIYGVMMGGLFTWEITGDTVIFSVAILSEMYLYFGMIIRDERFTGKGSTRWLLQPWWAFGIILTTFVSEFFMGGVLDLEIQGVNNFLSSVNFEPLVGGILGKLSALIYNFIIGFSAITSSPWFLIMMGLEMGTLVALKVRVAREFETKLRLVLLMLAYAVYSVLLPYFLIPASQLPLIPWVGWSMGVGTAAAVAPVFFIGIAGTYLVSGTLSFLFGARQLCSVMCTAPLMYQGTFYDSMKTFNRTSRLGRKLLTSRMSQIYKVTLLLVWASVISTSVLSYLNSVGIVKFTFFGTDTSQFMYSFYFNFLWYVIFISIPFIGTYGCVTTGMCHWGTFNQFVSRFGFFRLKVLDREVCKRCPTKDCAKACPVGLTDMPGHFIAKGEFKSSKCCGVGDCISACPYRNMYIYDVRHWIREKLGKPSSPKMPQLQTVAVANRQIPSVEGGKQLNAKLED